MDSGQLIYVLSRLCLGSLAAFFAIMLWAATRDAAWMLVIIGIIMAYVETIYSILKLLGMTGIDLMMIDSMPLMSILLPGLSMVFFIAALAVMVIKKYRRY